MPCTSSCSAALTISCTERLWPKWMTSVPDACMIRRMMLTEASCPSKSAVAVTKRTLFLGTYGAGFAAMETAFINSAPSTTSGFQRGARPRLKMRTNASAICAAVID